MLINELFETGGFWRGVGGSLAQRYTPGFDFSKTSYNTGPKLRQAASKAGQFVQRATAAAPAVTAPQSTVTQPAAPVTAQTPVATTTTAPVAPVATAATPTAAPAPTSATKPRVMSQQIRVGNKVYRPGDPMHARLSQMMQAQQQS